MRSGTSMLQRNKQNNMRLIRLCCAVGVVLRIVVCGTSGSARWHRVLTNGIAWIPPNLPSPAVKSGNAALVMAMVQRLARHSAVVSQLVHDSNNSKATSASLPHLVSVLLLQSILLHAVASFHRAELKKHATVKTPASFRREIHYSLT